MDIVSRLKIFIDSLQIGSTQFADQCGIPRPTISQILNGRNKKISDEIISKIHAAYPQLSILWLMFGEGIMGNAEKNQTSEPQNSGFSSTTSTISPRNQQNELFGFPHEKETAFLSENLSIDFRNDYTTNGENGNVSTNLFGESSPQRETMQNVSSDDDTSIDQANFTKHANTPDLSSHHIATSTNSPGHSNKPTHQKRISHIVVFYDDQTFATFYKQTDNLQ